MEPAVAPFREVVDAIELPRAARAGPLLRHRRAVRGRARELVAALTRPVRWTDVMAALRDAGATSYVETGPGRVLTNLVRKSLDGVQADAPLALEAAGA